MTASPTRAERSEASTEHRPAPPAPFAAGVPTDGGLWAGTLGSRVCISIRGRASRRLCEPLYDYAVQMFGRGYDRFEVDLLHCTYLEATFLGVLATLSLRLAERGFGRWHICGATALVLDRLTALGIDGFFDVSTAPCPAHPQAEEWELARLTDSSLHWQRERYRPVTQLF